MALIGLFGKPFQGERKDHNRDEEQIPGDREVKIPGCWLIGDIAGIEWITEEE